MHVIFEPLDFIARLAALVPKPRDQSDTLEHVYFRPGPRCGVSDFLKAAAAVLDATTPAAARAGAYNVPTLSVPVPRCAIFRNFVR